MRLALLVAIHIFDQKYILYSSFDLITCYGKGEKNVLCKTTAPLVENKSATLELQSLFYNEGRRHMSVKWINLIKGQTIYPVLKNNSQSEKKHSK